MLTDAQKRATAKYNAKTYGVIKVSLPKEMVEAFKKKAKERGDSQASIIGQAIENYLKV